MTAEKRRDHEGELVHWRDIAWVTPARARELERRRQQRIREQQRRERDARMAPWWPSL